MLKARIRFDTRIPQEVEQALRRATGEAPAKYLSASTLRRRWMDFCALGGVRSQLQFVRELVFPAPDYMRAKYGDAQWQWLPWLYLRRTCAGVLKVFRLRQSA